MQFLRFQVLDLSMTTQDELSLQRIAVVIPSYKVKRFIVDVIASMPDYVWRIYVVDDCCPEGSAEHVETHCKDSRVRVLRHEVNQGVGGAVMTGYRAAAEDGADVIVKVDGDGQMDPSLIEEFVHPILTGEADYTKGNRFYDMESLSSMPGIRVFGNAALSLLAKLSTGYWDLFDPTNGYTAIHADIARQLPFGRISRRYFFETDILFRLGTFRARVVDIPMDAVYGDEISNLKISRIFGEFLGKHARNFIKRVFYNYFLRDMSVASIELVTGLSIMLFGVVFGAWHWVKSASHHIATPIGTVTIAALSILCGLQLLLAFIGYDVSHVPQRAIHRRRPRPRTPLVNEPSPRSPAQ
jgi:glycosyltransferase involved in cell wall biosynthesis